MSRRTSGPSVLLLAGLLAAAAAAAAAEYPQLIESPLDIVWRTGGQPLNGVIQERRDDGTIVILINNTPPPQEIPKSRYERIDPRIMAGDSVNRRGAVILAARDWDDVLRTVNWGVKHNARKEALELAKAALTAEPAQPRLAELLISLLNNEGEAKPAEAKPAEAKPAEAKPAEAKPAEAKPLEVKGDPKQIEDIVRSVLKADPRWRSGRVLLLKILTDAPGREEEVQAALEEWLICAPTDPEPLKAMVAIHEKKGETREAMSKMRRLWESSKDPAAGISYARLLLRLGDVPRAQDVANQLVDNEATARPAKAIAGTARLMAGKTDEAEPLLRAAIDGELPPDLAPVARFNLALACYRLGKLDEARTLWTAIDQPVSRYALAVLDRQPVADLEALKPIASQVLLHNAMLEVEKRPGGVPLPDEVKALTTPMARFLQAVMAAFAPGAGNDTVRALASYPGPASLRWQAYAHLVAKRYDEAIAVLDQLPPEDGHGLAYRLHIALERKESSAANELWTRLQASSNPPRDWMARMQLVFDAATHESLVERFDLDGVTPPSGWVYNSFGTGIQLHQAGGKLWLEGRQRKAAEGITRAWRLVKQEQLKRIIADFDIAAAGAAIAGLEVLDAQRRTGVALGVKADRSLCWRQRGINGAWSDWTPLAMKAGEGMVKLALEYSAGQVKVFQVEAPDKVERLGDWDGRGGKGNELCISIFGTAEEAQEWKVGVDEIRIELNTKVKTRDGE